MLLAAGTKGKRFALPNSRVMIHQPSGGAGGQAADIAIQAREIIRWRKTLNETIAKHTGKTPLQVETDSDRDYYMSADEAKAYGIVDHVVASTRDAQKIAETSGSPELVHILPGNIARENPSTKSRRKPNLI